jgi:hypothetical protein
MACLPGLTPGDFTDRAWNAMSQHSNDNSILITYNSSGVEVSRANNPSDKITFTNSPGSNLKSTTFGDRYVLILEYYTVNNQMKRQKIYLIKTMDGQTLSRITLFDTGQSVTLYYPNPPFVGVSTGNNAVFHMYTQNQLQKATGLAFYRSDSGLVVCPTSGQAEVQLSGGLRIRGKYDGTKLKMFTNSPAQTLPTACSLPLGKSLITQLAPFNDALVGAGVPVSRQTSSTTFTIKNIGTNCLKIISISNSQHFYVKSPTHFPTIILDHNQQITVVIKFDPSGHIGTYTENLPVSFDAPVEAGSQTIIACHAIAKHPSNETVTPAHPHTE